MSSGPSPATALVHGEQIARYGFGEGHPFGPDRHGAFMRELEAQGLLAAVRSLEPREASEEELEWFHAPAFVALVRERSSAGQGFLDAGDTPAWPGIFEAAASVVGAALVAAEALMRGEVRRAFVPIAGLHHAGRDHAAGFCVFNDCGVIIELARSRYGLRRVAYVDIDAHHGDGVFYAFESDPELVFADIHEDGRYLYPGTGAGHETGTGAARGTKLNIALPPGADDAAFSAAWQRVEAHVEQGRPELIVLQCGADSLAGDPLAHLQFSAGTHGHAAARLCALAGCYCGGRVLALGGGGYDSRNLALAWTEVVRALS